MKLATLKNGQRDGQLVVVARDLRQAVIAQLMASDTVASAVGRDADLEIVRDIEHVSLW